MRALCALALALLAVSCALPDTPAEGALWCAADEDCPSGWVCRWADQRCYATAADDAGTVTRIERCTESLRDGRPGATPADEDLDGQIDEGCAYHFGTPQALPAPWAAGETGVPIHALHMSPDGLRLHFMVGDVPVRATRAKTQAGFDASEALSFVDEQLSWATYGGSGAEAIYARVEGSDLYRSERSEELAAFPAGAVLVSAEALGARRLSRPVLAPDNRELLFLAVDEEDAVTLHHALRASPGADFDAPEPLTLAGAPLDATEYSLSPDGRRLYFVAAGGPLRYAERATTHAAHFGPARDAAQLAPEATGETSPPVFSPRSREAFFASSRPWNTSSLADAPVRGLFRVQVCRDGACEDPLVSCDEASPRSPDGYHCYPALTSLRYAPARSGCRALAAATHETVELVSLLSPAEEAFLAGLMGEDDAMWLGIESQSDRWVWVSGEAMVYTNWSATTGAPSGLEQGIIKEAQWRRPVLLEAPSVVRCERTLFPVW